jgi:uncharacterized protein YyaL (SSP411 family)
MKALTNNFYLQIIKIIILFGMITNINAQEKHTNALIKEDSPYLQQHAHNPVNWFAWGDEAFKKAKDENKLIFLSIGYSTCHWCHVMEEESFEDEDVAKILNKYYVSIKVDREEMPHIDKYYQDVHNLLNKRGGGWPLSIIMSPDAKAFFAATYIPKEPRYGMSGIKELLLKIVGIYQSEPKKIIQSSLEIEKVLKDSRLASAKKSVSIDDKIIKKFVSEVSSSYDEKNKGIGGAPKFPHASTMQTLLDIYEVYSDKRALNMATNMLRAMAKGGINDQIEGGFFRYSVDESWMIPHFEKMLYTNAELLSSYAKAYEITNDEFFKEQVESIVNFVEARFEKDGLLFSASDADSLVDNEKEEGAYFVFDYEETKSYLESLGYKNSKEILGYFNINKIGNFENNTNNPYITSNKKPENLQQIKHDLKALRAKKEYPFIDYKILTSWNAMYISSLFEAGLNEKANFLLNTLIKELRIDGILYHQKLIGKKPKVKALFEDYAFLIDALLKSYEVNLNEDDLTLAISLTKEAISKFYKEKNWYMSDDDFKTIASVYDASYKSSLSLMLDNLEKLAYLKSNLYFYEIVRDSFKTNSYMLDLSPSNLAWLVRAYMFYTKGYVVLKSNKELLKDKKLSVGILKKVTNATTFQACALNSCFAYSDNFEQILKQIKDFKNN